MNIILKVAKFHLIHLFSGFIIWLFIVLLCNVLGSLAALKLARPGHPIGSNDFVAMIAMFFLGTLTIHLSFKYILSQGVSRKKYFLSVSLTLAMFAAIFALMATVFYIVSLRIARVWMIYESAYRDQGALRLIIWEFAALFLLAVLGWFLRLIYYVSGRRTQISISFAPFILIPLLILFDRLADGAIFRAIGIFFKTIMGFTSSIPNPYIATSSMLGIAVILGGLIFLLLRRAQIKA